MSAKTVFISYRRDATGKPFARSIKEALTHHGYDVFLDVDGLDAGRWATQILTEVPKRAHFLLLLTPGALDRCAQEDDWVRREFLSAVEHRRNIVPVREESVNLGELSKCCPECVKAVFDYQIATIQHAGFAQDIETLIQRFIPPHKAAAPIIEEQPPAHTVRADISRILKYAPAELIGREEEMKLLHDAWHGRADLPVSPDVGAAQQRRPTRPKVLTFVALGGEGKTSLIAKWAAELAAQDWPGCDAAFAWSFYSQGTREQQAASSDLFLKEALTFFGDDADKAFAASPAGAFEKGQRLARIVGQRRSLLILDGLEPLQYAPTSPTPGELKDQGVAALLKGLATHSHGLCVVTTRYSLPGLKAFWQTTAREVKLLRLSKEAGVHLLKTLGVRGTQKEFETLVEDVKGHALTLQIMGGFLKRAFNGDIRQCDRVKFEKADEKIDGGHAFRAMAAYEKWMEGESDEANRELAILRLTGLFERPATSDCIHALLQPPAIAGLTEPLVGVEQEDWQFSLDALDKANLLALNRDSSGTLISFDTHPHIREYFSKQLRENNPDAWRAAHRRLYEHLCAITKEGDQPTLEDLQPLYQAVGHGRQAGLVVESFHNFYWERVRHKGSNYHLRKLAAFGSDLAALSAFFDTCWSSPTLELPEPLKSGLLGFAGEDLTALGRLHEAVEAFQAAYSGWVEQGAWKNASLSATKLSNVFLRLGKVAEASDYGRRGFELAQCADDPHAEARALVQLADVVHQEGRREVAQGFLSQVKQIHAQHEGPERMLSSGDEFRNCDLLLSTPERIAWEVVLNSAEHSSIGALGQFISPLIESCRSTLRRAKQAITWATAEQFSLIDGCIHNLTAARAALYEKLLNLNALEGSSSEKPHSDKFIFRQVEIAVSGLRRAGLVQELPRGLLTRAWLRFVGGKHTGPESAQEDLDEAWEIAERGPMRLHMADIHLYRARLFFREAKYPWESPAADLTAAEKLINECGYHRRDEELGDAKRAILGGSAA